MDMENHTMRTRIIGTAAVLAFALAAYPLMAQTKSSPPASQKQAPVSVEECATMWKGKDVGSDKTLSSKDATKYKAQLAAIDTNKDGKISEAEFMEACKSGVIKG
jgi:hypothetical protein